MKGNSCAKCRYAILPSEWRDIAGIKCARTGEPALGLCEQFTQEVGQEHRVIAVSPEAEGAFVALASALGYHVRKVNP